MNTQRFHELWIDYLDGRLTDADEREVQELFSTEPGLRERVLRDGELHGLLQALGRVDATEDEFVSRVARQLLDAGDDVPFRLPDPPVQATTSAEPTDQSRRCQVSPPPIPPPIVADHPAPPPLPIAGKTPRTKRLWTALLAAAALVSLIGLSAALLVALKDDVQPVANEFASQRRDLPNRHNPTPPATSTPAKEDMPVEGEPVDDLPYHVAPMPDVSETRVAETRVAGKPRPIQPSPDAVDDRPPARPPTGVERPAARPQAIEQPAPATVVYGRIADDSEADWDSQVPTSLRSELLRLRKGGVTIEMTGGAQLVVRGPAEFALDSTNSVSLKLGRLSATVPVQATGFAVKTPSSKVVDIGTEFVVEVDDAGATAVQVLRGEVEVSARRDGEEEQRWQLTSGQYKWVSHDGSQDFDWRMQLTVDEKSFQGLLQLNGQEFAFAKAEEFLPLYTKMTLEWNQLRQLVSVNRRPRGKEPFRAEIDINGQRTTVSNVTEYSRSYRRVNDQLRQLLTAALKQGTGSVGGAFSGSFNIDGEEFRINSLEDLRKLQEEIERRVDGGFKGGGERLPPNPSEERKEKAGDGAARKPPGPKAESVVDEMPKNAAELVQLALRAELDGRNELRDNVLAVAIEADSNYAPARWHSGQIRVSSDEAGDEWLTVKEAERRAVADATLAEYARVRAANSANAAGQEAVAKWCRAHGMTDQEKVHWAAVLRELPAHEKARDCLKLKEYQGRLLTQEQIADLKEFNREEVERRREWAPKLNQWRKELCSKDVAAQDDARRQLQAITDPHLVHLLETYFLEHGETAEREAVAALGNITDQTATESLLRRAVLSKWPAVRSDASQQLSQRPWHGYVPLLIDGMKVPLEFESWGQENTFGVDYQYVLRRKRKYVDHVLQGTLDVSIEVVEEKPDSQRESLSNWLDRKRHLADEKARSRQGDMRRYVDRVNTAAARYNQLIRETLIVTTGQDFGDDPEAWNDWWNDYNEYHAPKPTLTQYVQHRFTIPLVKHLSCFPAGTLVWTQSGPRNIETIRVGDVVLSQNPKTGELAGRPVLQTTLRPPSPTLEVRIAGEAVQATKGHPFWVNGRGWRMTKFLEPGDRLHGVHGAAGVESVRETGVAQPAYNLVVSEFNTYFVGEVGVLVHDNTPTIPPGVSIPGEKLVLIERGGSA